MILIDTRRDSRVCNDPILISNLWIYIASDALINKLMYYDFVDDFAIVGCFLLC